MGIRLQVCHCWHLVWVSGYLLQQLSDQERLSHHHVLAVRNWANEPWSVHFGVFGHHHHQDALVSVKVKYMIHPSFVDNDHITGHPSCVVVDVDCTRWRRKVKR